MFFALILLSNILLLKANDTIHYWYNGGKKTLITFPQKKFILIDSSNLSKVSNDFAKNNLKFTEFKKMFASPQSKAVCNKMFWTIADLSEQENTTEIIYEFPLCKSESGKLVSPTNLFYVKLKNGRDSLLLQKIANDLNVITLRKDRYMPLWYTLFCTKESRFNAVSSANYFYETGLFAASEPDIMVNNSLQCVNDTYYSDQWGLSNTGQSNGVSGVDIRFCEARTITTGNSSITIAVIDHGIESNHPDIANLGNVSYDSETDASPSIVRGKHGTACAGIIGAKANNTIGISGIAPDCNLMSISSTLYLFTPNIREKLSKAINFAWKNGADVLSNSWGHPDLSSSYKNDAIDSALTFGRGGKGCVVVFSSGNDNQSEVEYPADREGVVAVGAIDRCGNRSGRIDVVPESCDPWGINNKPGSSYGSKLSVVAPGTNISTTDLVGNYGYNTNSTQGDYMDRNYTRKFGGTSAAAPYVAGVAALMLSVNPNLSVSQVKTIIEQTAQKVGDYTYLQDFNHPNGNWNMYTGYGLVDAYTAVKAARNYDLYTRDNLTDDGSEPLYDPLNGLTDSPDIWLRNYPDGGNTHQQMVNGTNYLYVNIHNKSTSADTSWTTDSVRVFAKPTFLNWHHWSNSSWTELCVAPLPRLAPGMDTTICIPVSNQGLFAMNTNYALYSRIESHFDQLSVSETISVGRNVEDNNNISLKNVYITNDLILPNNFGLDANVNISPYPSTVTNSRLKLNFSDGTYNILDEAEVILIFPEDVMTDWSPSLENLKQFTCNTFLATGETVELFDIPETDITLHYNFLTRRNQPRQIYKNHIIQYAGEDEAVVGGITIQIEKPERFGTDLFHANAGNDTAVLLNTTATLHATQINENATYRWYDKQRNFKYEGVNYSVMPSQTSEYILEVTAESDGYRDLDTVKVNVVPGCIRSITPNPVTDNWVNVSYEYATTVTAAQLLIYNTGTTTLVGNYDLNNLGNVSSLDIEVTNYPTGSYTVVLVCDNAVCHSKVLIRQ